MKKEEDWLSNFSKLWNINFFGKTFGTDFFLNGSYTDTSRAWIT
jgi:hypothetical protein